MRKLINKFKELILKSPNPYFVYFIILFLSKRNRYINKKYLGYGLLKNLVNRIGFSKFLLSGTGVLVLFYKDSVIKIPLSDLASASLKKDLKFYNEAVNNRINIFFNYSFNKLESGYKMDLLNENKNLHSDYIKKLQLIGIENSIYIQKELSIRDCLYLCPNYGVIESRCGFVFDLEKNINVAIGFMHGDLTNRNLLADVNGNCCLIDLDRSTFDGIRELDEVHYLVDEESKRKGMSFFTFIEENLNSLNIKFELNIIYLYLMYRLCVECKVEIILNDTYYIEAKNCHDFLCSRMV
jgi:hypothetical protein